MDSESKMPQTDTHLKSLANELLQLLSHLQVQPGRPTSQILEHVEAETLKATLIQYQVITRNLQINFSAINRLPLEVLALVFNECRPPLPSMPGTLLSDEPGTHEDSHRKAFQYISNWIVGLLHMVLFDKNILKFEGSKVFFELSGAIQIDLFLLDIPSDQSIWIETLLFDSSSRLKSLCIHPHLLFSLNSQAMYPSITQIAVFPSDRIADHNGDDPDVPSPSEQLRAVLQKGTPKITQLFLHSLDPLVRSDQQQTLTHLCIMFDNTRTVSVEILLLTLSNYNALGELILSFTSHAIHLRADTYVQSVSVIHLPNLRLLVCNQATPEFSSAFLSHTNLPEEVKVHIMGTFIPDEVDDISIVDILSTSFIEKSFPSITQLFLSCRPQEMCFSASTAPGAECGIEIHSNWHSGHHHHPGVNIISRLGYYIPLDKIQKFDFVTDVCSRLSTTQSFFWWLPSLTALRTLCFDVDQATRPPGGILPEIERGKCYVIPYLALLSSKRYPQLPSPALTELILRGIGDADDTCLDLREVLEKRASAGFPISKITFIVFVDEDELEPDSQPGEEVIQKVEKFMEGMSNIEFEVTPYENGVLHTCLEPPPVIATDNCGMSNLQWRQS
ncbi:hypothetical protein C8Q75DRAFT_893726 [Abortiporus biennis]|nr:hypothetical protein C8Q75DRAFT_893726 [Abortiporus biennis]